MSELSVVVQVSVPDAGCGPQPFRAGESQGVCSLFPLLSGVSGTILKFPEGWASGADEAFQAVLLGFFNIFIGVSLLYIVVLVAAV